MPSNIEVLQGDCLEVLRGLPSNSFDALVTDPPSGIAFMGKEWDEDKGGRTNWIWWLGLVMREVIRVLKPGAHGFVWALPRTSHWTATALEDAGFEIRDCVVHAFGSGFPKSANVSKLIDKMAGANRKVTAARAWSGWGTAIKPAIEMWWLVRKPFEGTVAENVQRWGTGAINIDGARVAHANAEDLEKHRSGVAAIKARGGKMENSWANASDLSGANDVNAEGRWPANFVLSHSADCKASAASRKASAASRKASAASRKAKGTRADKRGASQSIGAFSGEGVQQYVYEDAPMSTSECAPDCPVRRMQQQGGSPHFFHCFDADPDVAKYDPFFYTAKAARSEKEANLGGVGGGVGGLRDGGRGAHEVFNVHSTVKPLALMRHLVRLITPPKGRVLDPFGGSGTTGVACLREAIDAVLIEREAPFVKIIRGRCGLIG